MTLTEVFRPDKWKFNWTLGITLGCALAISLIVLAALHVEVYRLSMS